MPSKKIFVILIICVGIIASVMILQWGIGVKQIKANNQDLLVSNSIENEQNANLKNWQAVLSKISSTTVETTDNTVSNIGNGTLTDQMAKDFFGQYLVLTQNGTTVTDTEANQIAQNTILGSNYTSVQGKVYTREDLRIEKIANSTTKKTYNVALMESIQKRYPSKSDDELNILSNAMQSGSEAELKKLDPIIIAYKGLISDMMTIKVPYDVVTLHLEFLNTTSNILANIESMRQSFVDPVRSLSAIKQYQDNIVVMYAVLKKFSIYFSQ